MTPTVLGWFLGIGLCLQGCFCFMTEPNLTTVSPTTILEGKVSNMEVLETTLTTGTNVTPDISTMNPEIEQLLLVTTSTENSVTEHPETEQRLMVTPSGEIYPTESTEIQEKSVTKSLETSTTITTETEMLKNFTSGKNVTSTDLSQVTELYVTTLSAATEPPLEVTTSVTASTSLSPPVALGHLCSYTTDCQAIHNDTECINSTCTCKEAYFSVNATQCLPAPLAPTIRTDYSATPNSVHIELIQRSTLTSEQYYITVTDNEDEISQLFQTSNTSVRIDLKSAGAHYTVHVKATYNSGKRNSTNSSSISVTTVPVAVMSVTFTHDPVNSTTQVAIAWHLPGEVNVADSFTIVYKKNGSLTETEITTQFVSSSTTYKETIGGLEPGQEYSFQVVSISSPWNASSSWFTYTTYPAAVVNVTVSNITTVTADVAWTKGRGGVDHFEVRHKLGGHEYRAVIRITAYSDTENYAYHLTGLMPGYAHHFTVTAYTNGVESKIQEFSVMTYPPYVTDLSDFNVTNTSVGLSWMILSGHVAYFSVSWNITANDTHNSTVVYVNNNTVLDDTTFLNMPQSYTGIMFSTNVMTTDIPNINASNSTFTSFDTGIITTSMPVFNDTRNSTVTSVDAGIPTTDVPLLNDTDSPTGITVGTQIVTTNTPLMNAMSNFTVTSVNAGIPTTGVPLLNDTDSPTGITVGTQIVTTKMPLMNAMTNFTVTSVDTETITTDIPIIHDSGSPTIAIVPCNNETLAGSPTIAIVPCNNETLAGSPTIAIVPCNNETLAGNVSLNTMCNATSFDNKTISDDVSPMSVNGSSNSSVDNVGMETLTDWSVVLRDLTPGQAYLFTVYSVNNGLHGSGSEIVSYTNPPDITDLAELNTSDTSITLGWRILHGHVALFLISWNITDDTSLLNMTSNSTDTSGHNVTSSSSGVNIGDPIVVNVDDDTIIEWSVAVQDLTAGQLYLFTIYSENNGRQGTESEILSYTNPSLPIMLHVSAITTYSLSIDWEPGLGSQDRYEIRWKDVDANSGLHANATLNDEYLITNLTPGNSYVVTVVAVFQDKLSTEAQLIANTKPSPPTNGFVQDVMTESIALRWDVGVGRAAYFIVSQNSGDNKWNSTNLQTEHNMTSLEPGTRYCFTVTAYVGQQQSAGLHMCNYTMPLVPQSLSRIVSSSNSLELFWDTPRGGYDRYVVTAIPAATVGNVSSAAGLHVLLTDLHPGTQYSVSMTVEAGVWSSETVTFQAYTNETAPGAPINVTFASATDHIDLLWTLDPGEAHGVILHYIIEYWRKDIYTDANQTREVHATQNNSTFTTVHNLVPGSCYLVRVAAVNGAGQGSPSAMITASTNETVPGNVTSVVVTSSTSRSLLVTWSPPVNPNGIVERYVLKVMSAQGCQLVAIFNYCQGCPRPSCHQDLSAMKPVAPPSECLLEEYSFSLDNSSLDYTATQRIKPYTYYTVSIHALTRQGPGSSVEKHVTTLQDAPSRPTNLLVAAVNSTSMYLNWTEPAEPNGIIRYYQVQHNTSAGVDTTMTEGNATEITVSGLQKWMFYTFSVVGCTVKSGENSSASQRTQQDTPGQPANFVAAAYNASCIRLTWGLPAEPNGIITKYGLIYNTSANSEDADTLSTTKFSHLLCGLMYWTIYQLRLNAWTKMGGGDYTSAVVRTLEYVPTTPVRSVDTEFVFSDEISLVWVAPEKPNGVITGYTIRLVSLEHKCGSNQINNEALETNSSETRHTLRDLDPYWTYNITMYARTKKGVSTAPSEVLAVRTDQDAPDLVDVSTVHFTNISSDSIAVTWSPPCIPNGVIRQYRVLWKLHSPVSSNENLAKNREVSEPLTKLTSLLPYREYDVQVAAETNKIGQYSAVKTVLTAIGAPHAPHNLMIQVLSSSSVKVSWQPPDLKTGPTTYTVHMTDSVAQGAVQSKCSVIGFHEKSCVVEELAAFWNYTFTVESKTEAGSIQSGTSNQIRTLPYYPRLVQTLKASREKDVYTWVTLSWAEPKLEDRNGIISEYRITSNMNFNETTSELQAQLTVVPENNYIFTVSAINQFGEGKNVSTEISIPSGPPVKPPETVNNPLVKTEANFALTDAKKQIAIAVPSSFFSDNVNGQNVLWGFIVSDASQIKSANAFSGTKAEYEKQDEFKRTWWMAESANFEPYRATSIKWQPNSVSTASKVKRAASDVFIVGQDGDCSGQSQIDHCNGYLKPGQSYRVKAFACTGRGCTESIYSQPIDTAPDLTIPILGAVCAAVAVVMFLFVIVLMKRKQIACFSKAPTKFIDKEMDVFGEDNNALELAEKDRHRPVRLAEFSAHVDRMRKDAGLLFANEYMDVKDFSPHHPTEAAEHQANRNKNRYTNILSFDRSRVTLLSADTEEGSDYINANYIPGYKSKREYVAAQGPLPGTKDDFWRMIWEQDVHVIIMLTKLVERGRVKCEQYWPDDNEPVYFGDIIVQTRSQSVMADYVIRILDVKLEMQTRKVTQFHFKKWPDFGCPKTSRELIRFMREIDSHCPHRTIPTLIHCSAGVGRTGTYIAVDRLLQHIRENDTIDIFNLVLEMRDYRSLMVQTEDQYKFIHSCIKDNLTAEPTSYQEEEPIYVNN